MKFTLPDGQSASLPEAQARAVWQHWEGCCGVALARGEGVSIVIDYDHDTVEICTVYAPQWEGLRVVIAADGSASAASEQQAPDYAPTTRPAPWERGPLPEDTRP